ncbi:MAG: phosphate acyltransferase PlsX [Rhodospirillales bacterium]|nr:phosphate acyltransferase PlsX [Rhodospirillales bacterium]MDH3791491.1 phosphate acyltransferase PlsX [Rhodospirillales bacterium]MDH3918395.1 phosphate acyltransferase PlsX [Rhodospirillales bacterium]MDH3969501.1 phosphate acyltransferase PlsX [Rhodospirillales bacterium]
MSGRLTIALDAMGGDNAPQVVIRGANIARQRYPQVDFLLFGQEAKIRPLLDRMTKLRDVATIVHTDDVVRSDDKPSAVLRSGRNSSMRRAINAVHEGRADGVVSAGNTGALMAMSKFVLKTLPGVDRPAISSFFPTLKGESMMLDLGANLSCDAGNLVDFAVLGTAFARTVLDVPEPTFGLLNVGSEEIKGHEALHEASAILREATTLQGRFLGFVEGDDITKGNADVIVTDGFTGNVAIKTAEGTAKLVNEFMRRSFKSSALAGIGYLLARPALNQLRQRLDPRRYNGAVFLGLNGIVVKSHGGTDAMGFANAVGVAVDLLQHDFIEQTRAACEAMKHRPFDKRAAAS